ncbi:MAG TPA: efflux RND transporter permease subunit, partial [Victivallales bacterium]|nr:efflux RND transporter permease subunit [Victivallales bacterium]
MQEKRTFITEIVQLFLTGPLSFLFVLSALFLGILGVILTPREEEPQIVVPMIDITVDFPGYSPKEVEELVTTPLERLLWQVSGVEHVYSTSFRDRAMVIVRFHVGEDYTESMVKVRDKMDENMHLIHPDVKRWELNPVEIDDVPVISFTLFSPDKNIFELRRITEEIKARMDASQDIFQSEIIGGSPREILIEPDIEKLTAHNLSINDIINVLRRNNNCGTCGFSVINGKYLRILTSPPLETIDDIKNLILISAEKGGVVRLCEVAKITDRPAEYDNYTEIYFGPSAKITEEFKGKSFECVTLAFSKKKGVNSVTFTEKLIAKAQELKKEILPEDVELVITRNYGETANSKVNDLLSSLAFAMITVIGLIAFTMGWREGIVVGLAVPVSFSLSLFTNYVAGYTINRVTLFALILSLGMVVDDPITNVDNIQRHLKMRLFDPLKATLHAVQEVLPPVILSTIAIIISFTPMFFITGMMGPYMKPMAINVPLTVTFSTLCALTFVPFLSLFLLKNLSNKGIQKEEKDPTPEWIKKSFAFLIKPFFKKRNAYIFLFIVVLATLLSALLMLKIPLKMLPFDNKNELQIILDMPEGTPLEDTVSTAKRLSAKLSTYNEVKDCTLYAGINSPIDFNGLVRHYYMRREPNQAEIRVNLADKNFRKEQSHSIALRIRDELTKIAEDSGGILKII